jgi:two-component system, chemotaxis family, protein-glutamate methylesterase/glutaminase
MIKVFVVDDSPTAREYLVHIFESDPAIEVIGTAHDGAKAVELADKLKPDVITMDIHMPFMNGIEATRKIMETNPVPIVIVSGVWDPKEVETTFKAIEAGALAVVQRPGGAGQPECEDSRKELISKVKLMSEVRVVRRWPRPRQQSAASFDLPPTAGHQSISPRREVGVVAIGASTGGPLALRTILSGIPSHFPAPLLIVQHIASGFIGGMLEWLSETSSLHLHVARKAERMLPGHAYFAPDGLDMGVDKDGTIHLSKDGPPGIRPSVAYLFRSVMEAFGAGSVGVLLTGMGKDGAQELKALKDKGALTIAQDEESCVVFGMPGEAARIDAARYVLPPDEIAAMLARIDISKAQKA